MLSLVRHITTVSLSYMNSLLHTSSLGFHACPRKHCAFGLGGPGSACIDISRPCKGCRDDMHWEWLRLYFGELLLCEWNKRHILWRLKKGTVWWSLLTKSMLVSLTCMPLSLHLILLARHCLLVELVFMLSIYGGQLTDVHDSLIHGDNYQGALVFPLMCIYSQKFGF
jgi:hypothetical protein